MKVETEILGQAVSLVASVSPLGQLSFHYPWYYHWASIK